MIALFVYLFVITTGVWHQLPSYDGREHLSKEEIAVAVAGITSTIEMKSLVDIDDPKDFMKNTTRVENDMGLKEDMANFTVENNGTILIITNTGNIKLTNIIFEIGPDQMDYGLIFVIENYTEFVKKGPSKNAGEWLPSVPELGINESVMLYLPVVKEYIQGENNTIPSNATWLTIKSDQGIERKVACTLVPEIGMQPPRDGFIFILILIFILLCAIFVAIIMMRKVSRK